MILDQLAAHARERVATAEARRPLADVRAAAGSLPPKVHAFSAALVTPGLSFVCEVKKASPSKGIIDERFDYEGIARDYEAAGADAVSCLTEPEWFLGSDEVFSAVRSIVSAPMLRKDFTVDEYQIYEARLLGADAVLLICAILSDDELARGIELADSLGMDALVEAHDERELARAGAAGARIVGVNNRDLRDFSVDPRRAARLMGAAPPEALFVAESGIREPADVRGLSPMGVDAVLVGEALMRAADKAATLAAMREEASR
jgi:indole-3-glycerol phosphate synthase